MASWEADADIVAVSFHSHTPNNVSGTVPGPDVGVRSQGAGVGDVLLLESERFKLAWAAMLWGQGRGRPRWPAAAGLAL